MPQTVVAHPHDYWASGAGLTQITPAGKAWPEGDGFAELLCDLTRGCTVLDFGCGIGRLANLFDPSRYRGIDICTQALERARAACPAYEFSVIDETTALPCSDITLTHTVLLHVADDALGNVIARFASERVIVSEILGRHWRRSGDPPVFNREAAEYEAAFAPRFRLGRLLRHPYPHYAATDLTIMEFVSGRIRDTSGLAGCRRA